MELLSLNFWVAFATTASIYAIFALALNVHWGYTGIFNFGVVGFFLVGAYTSALLTVDPAGGTYERYIGGLELPFGVGVLAAALASGLLALLIGIPTLRLREDYLAIATIGVAEALRVVVINVDGLANSTRGIVGIPRPLSGLVPTTEYRFLYFAITLVILAIIFVAIERGIRSPWGRALRAIREDEATAAASGKDIVRFRMQSFVFGAMIIGAGGAVYAHRLGSISPDSFTHLFGTFIVWAMLIVGGSGNNKGAVLGAFAVWGIWTVTGLLRGYLPGFLDVRIFYVRDMLIGLLIISVLILRPRGLLGEERQVSLVVEREAKREARRGVHRGAEEPRAPPVAGTSPRGQR